MHFLDEHFYWNPHFLANLLPADEFRGESNLKLLGRTPLPKHLWLKYKRPLCLILLSIKETYLRVKREQFDPYRSLIIENIQRLPPDIISTK